VRGLGDRFGNELDNMITGNIGDDVIAGAGGDDTLRVRVPAKTLCAAPAVPSNAAGAGVVRNVLAGRIARSKSSSGKPISLDLYLRFPC
jgi:hypothetical protein